MERWIPTLSMLLVSLISYIDRNTLALIAPMILADSGLSAQQYGFIISAFSIAYMIGNPLWGMLLDRFGLRAGMLTSVSFWTLASAAHAFAGGFWSFAVARAMLGLGEGATFPGGLRTAMQTLPEGMRSRGIAVAYSGGSLGAIVTPILVTPVAVAYGWRAAFLMTGLVGFLWVILWFFVSRRLPPHVVADNAHASAAMKWTDPRLWAYMFAYALGALPLGFILYGAAIYLTKVRLLTMTQAGALLWIPPLGWEVGYFFWGWMADRVHGRFERVFLAAMILSLPLMLVPIAPSVGLVMVGLFIAMFVGAGFIILSIAYATKTFPSSHAGLLAGLGAGSWSAAVAVVMPVFGRLFDQGKFEEAFLLASLFPIVGYGAWRGLTVSYIKFQRRDTSRVC